MHHLSEILDEDSNIDEDYSQVQKQKESTYVYPYQVEPNEQAKSDWRHVIRSAFIYGDRGINRMLVLKETESVSAQITDPLQQVYSTLSQDKKNVLGEEALSVTIDDCESVAATIRTGGEIFIYGHGSVKDGRGSHAFRIRSSSKENADYIESSAVSSGDKRWITSLCTKTLSMLGGLYLI